MDIEQVEYSRIAGMSCEGVRVVFTYKLDDDVGPELHSVYDKFDIVKEHDAQTVMHLLLAQSDPIYLLATLRGMTNVPLH